MNSAPHQHRHGPPAHDRAFALGVALNLGFVIVEVAFGVLAHSTALIADAGHNLSDVLGLALAWGAGVLARRLPTPRRTYGLRRTTILAAVANAGLLFVAMGAIALEAVQRLATPAPVVAGTVIAVAAAGVAVNLGTALLFRSGHTHDLNVRGAYLHMAADAAVSLGVVAAGLGIRWTGWLWLDPVASLGIVVVVILGTWGLLRDSLNLALDAVPAGIDPAEVQRYLAGIPGVTEVHELHIWAMSTTDAALTAHLVIPTAPTGDALVEEISAELHRRFGIEHATLQIERRMVGLRPPMARS